MCGSNVKKGKQYAYGRNIRKRKKERKKSIKKEENIGLQVRVR